MFEVNSDQWWRQTCPPVRGPIAKSGNSHRLSSASVHQTVSQSESMIPMANLMSTSSRTCSESESESVRVDRSLSEIPIPSQALARASTGSWGLASDGQDDTPTQRDKSKYRVSDTGDLEPSPSRGAGAPAGPSIELEMSLLIAQQMALKKRLFTMQKSLPNAVRQTILTGTRNPRFPRLHGLKHKQYTANTFEKFVVEIVQPETLVYFWI